MSDLLWNNPIKIGNFKLKNRIVFPPMGTSWAEEDGSVTKRVLNNYIKIP